MINFFALIFFTELVKSLLYKFKGTRITEEDKDGSHELLKDAKWI